MAAFSHYTREREGKFVANPFSCLCMSVTNKTAMLATFVQFITAGVSNPSANLGKT